MRAEEVDGGVCFEESAWGGQFGTFYEEDEILSELGRCLPELGECVLGASGGCVLEVCPPG